MKKVAPSLFLILCLLFSCAEEQNFNQADDLSVIPTFATSIFYFESPESVINALPANSIYIETFTFLAFNETFVADRILDGTITYELENTTSKNIDIIVEFLDDTDTVLDNEIFQILPEPSAVLERQVVYGDDGKNVDILRNTTSIRVSGINLDDNTSVSTAADPSLILRSSASFRLKLQ